jgi:hypothetical protein
VSSDSKDEQAKLILDREAFQQLLAAAFVLQQHNERLSQENPGVPPGLREIQLIPGRRDLDLRSALTLVAERLQKVSGATGVSICVVEEGNLRLLVCAGLSARVPGGAIAANCVVATERLCKGKAFHSPDAERDVRVDLAMCRHAGIGSLLAVAIPSENGVAGLIELRSASTKLFGELEESCRWTAGVVRELLDQHSARSRVPEFPLLAHSAAQGETIGQPCRVCGEPLREDEAFCGNCSMPRSPGAGAENLQSKWASLWFMDRAQRALSDRSLDGDTPQATSLPAGGVALDRAPAKTADQPPPATRPVPARPPEAPEIWGPLWAAVKQAKLARWLWTRIAAIKSAFKKPALGRLPRRRLVLVSAVVALIIFLLQWSAFSESNWFESLLSELGLAQEVAHTRAYSGNPDVRVWVDANAGVYYCPGSSLYGKTPGGHFARQRSAQQEQIEPATRMPCW